MANKSNLILENISVAPDSAKYKLYRWGDYTELRCLTHKDKRFSRDNLAEAVGESKDLNNDGDDNELAPDEFDLEDSAPAELSEEEIESDPDEDETLTANTFRLLQWRAHAFGDDWPFTIDPEGMEIMLREALTIRQYLYLQLLLSALLRYCPSARRKTYTGTFEDLSFFVFKDLMPQTAEVHQFGVAHSARYKGKLFARLTKLAEDVRGTLMLTEHDFPKNDAGDGGLDIVAWHPLGDERDNIPIAFAQCGCTAEGWPNKMLEASPAKLNRLHVGHSWATYYFMPLDLTQTRGNKMQWAEVRDINSAIVIDRLRIMRLADVQALDKAKIIVREAVDEALEFQLT